MKNHKLELKAVLFWVLSRSLIFNVSGVDQFGDLNFDYAKKIKSNEVMISIISIGLGYRKLNLLSFAHGKLKIVRIINFEHNLEKINEEVSEQLDKYLLTLNKKDNEELEIELDFIKYKLSQSQAVINTTEFKMNFYFAFLLFLLTIILQQYDTLSNGLKYGNPIGIIAIAGLVYSLLNCLLIILEYFKVKGVSRSLFSELKNTDKAEKKSCQLRNYYYDWRHTDKESTYRVTYILNVQRYFKLALIALSIFYLSINIGVYNNVENTNKKFYSINYEATKLDKLKMLTLISELKGVKITLVSNLDADNLFIDQVIYYGEPINEVIIIQEEAILDGYKIIVEEE